MCVAAVLAGCDNNVTSPAPLFSAKDARGQAQLRSGVWAYADASRPTTCKVDTAQPVDRWDSCAGGVVVRPGELLERSDPAAPPKLAYRTVLARGAPAVLQILPVDGDHSGPVHYDYGGLRPLKVDDRGRVIALKGWEAMCGPPPPDDPTRLGNSLTLRPIAGLVLDKTNDDCIARSQGPLRVAARKSEVWSDRSDSSNGVVEFYLRWVRDGER